MANIEETNPANQDKVILYHGESYGTWIYQMLLKAFLYPNAPEDWLPLRMEKIEADIDKMDLIQLLNQDKHDHNPEYIKIGLSVTPNLYSIYGVESAWGTICLQRSIYWHKISGLSQSITVHRRLYGELREKFIPAKQWGTFKMQKKLLNYFIQEKRKQDEVKVIKDYIKKVEEYFPRTLKQFPEEFKSFFEHLKTWKGSRKIFSPTNENDFTEGVALQIIIDKELADQIVYDSHSFGRLKSGRILKGKILNEEDIVPYSEVYQKVKNHKDNEQARLALNNDFRQYSSRIKIKVIAGIMKNPTDYEIVKSMIKEMVAFRHQ